MSGGAASASWRNMVERFFHDRSENQPQLGVFHNVSELEHTTEKYLVPRNSDPKPFILTVSAADVLAKVVRACARLNKLQSV